MAYKPGKFEHRLVVYPGQKAGNNVSGSKKKEDKNKNSNKFYRNRIAVSYDFCGVGNVCKNKGGKHCKEHEECVTAHLQDLLLFNCNKFFGAEN